MVERFLLWGFVGFLLKGGFATLPRSGVFSRWVEVAGGAGEGVILESGVEGASGGVWWLVGALGLRYADVAGVELFPQLGALSNQTTTIPIPSQITHAGIPDDVGLPGGCGG